MWQHAAAALASCVGVTPAPKMCMCLVWMCVLFASLFHSRCVGLRERFLSFSRYTSLPQEASVNACHIESHMLPLRSLYTYQSVFGARRARRSRRRLAAATPPCQASVCMATPISTRPDMLPLCPCSHPLLCSSQPRYTAARRALGPAGPRLPPPDRSPAGAGSGGGLLDGRRGG